ncbi:hypothetical protein I3842_12G118700 [Carya illinoinensis]|uniref:Protein kinase domain-containing protein n=1 Tax=Carya illinoinensis TaxID=32201 RepID=A0A922IXU8_CARIL|nr:hypothetical protein I3842_12G118700 [Carya illinoinensis]
MFLPFSQRKPHQEIALRSPSTEWVRGEPVGHGSFATVNLAIPRNGSTHASPLMVVKSSESSCSVSLKSEKQVLDQLSTCPQVIRCLGEDRSVENGEELYNLFLEGASHGSLADQLKNRGGSLPESDVRRYVKSVIKGLRDVHARGFVHCDIKLQNREAVTFKLLITVNLKLKLNLIYTINTSNTYFILFITLYFLYLRL